MGGCKRVIIFGGSGYIGGFLANYLVDQDVAEMIVLADISPPRKEVWSEKLTDFEVSGKLIFEKIDVRNPICLHDFCPDVIFNFAAIHREPGHQDHEYFRTNISGAENVVRFAEETGCKTIVFTSSIAPYGHAEVARDEGSQVVPYSPYGSSKLVAEKIHQGWQQKSSDNKLVIVRPGVIFGPYEDGNVPRLKNALKKNAFCYVGNRDVQKAGGYVKELVGTMLWTLELMQRTNTNSVLYNFSFEAPPTLEQYVTAVSKVLGVKRFVPNVPYFLVLGVARVVHVIAGIFGINHPAHPERIKKLRVNNIIIPKFLKNNGYQFKYSLEESLEDWKKHAPEEW